MTPKSDGEFEFSKFLRRVRAGDGLAAEELVKQYEAEIRLEVRTRLRLQDARLRRVFDSMDICQSVLASFFIRAAVGEFDLEEPHQLVHLLVGMARNKLADRVKHHQRQRRDVRRVQGLDPGAEPTIRSDETPSQLVAGRELIQKFRDRMTAEERRLADLRSNGLDWVAVADALGGTPEGRRKQLSRAIVRIEQQLGLDVPAE